MSIQNVKSLELSPPTQPAGIRRWAFRISALFASVCVSLAVTELCLRVLVPSPYIIPASDWTPEYGAIHYPDARIVNAHPGRYHYVYTTNSMRYRGQLVDPRSPEPKIILLGDSNIFGFGLQDEETISERMNFHYAGRKRAVNLGNGGWGLGQEVRRYLELGQTFRPSVVVLYFARNDLKDLRYGIHWVAYADEAGQISLRDAPVNPAGRIRKLLPPDGFAYSVLMRSQLFMRVKALLNKMLTGVRVKPDGTTEHVDDEHDSTVRIPDAQVIVSNVAENERRYAALLDAFARHLHREEVRFLFLCDDEGCCGSALLSAKIRQLDKDGLLEWLPISRWFEVGKDLPSSPQGHHFGTEAADQLAQRLIRVIEETR